MSNLAPYLDGLRQHLRNRRIPTHCPIRHPVQIVAPSREEAATLAAELAENPATDIDGRRVEFIHLATHGRVVSCLAISTQGGKP